jgi:hypothetical protein
MLKIVGGGPVLSGTAIWYALLEEAGGGPLLNLTEADGQEQALGGCRGDPWLREDARLGKSTTRGKSWV